EDLSTISEAEGERAGNVTDVREALTVICAAPVDARGPLSLRQHFCRGNEPQPRVAEERSRGRSKFGRRLGALTRLRRGCLSLGASYDRTRGKSDRERQRAKRRRHRLYLPRYQQVVSLSILWCCCTPRQLTTCTVLHDPGE